LHIFSGDGQSLDVSGIANRVNTLTKEIAQLEREEQRVDNDRVIVDHYINQITDDHNNEMSVLFLIVLFIHFLLPFVMSYAVSICMEADYCNLLSWASVNLPSGAALWGGACFAIREFVIYCWNLKLNSESQQKALNST